MWTRRERMIVAAIVVALLGTAVGFRVMHLGNVPGINGDEGWWGVQATRWLHGEAYEAKTTSGNPIDMLFLVPIGLLHRFAGPSFFVLRLFPAVTNLVGLALGFVLAKRIFGTPTALVHTITLAILPTAISHSRFCQDPSQSVLWTSIVIYLCLLGLQQPRRWWLYLGAATVAMGLAFWTHPTNVFVAPFLVLPLAPALAHRIPESRRGKLIFAAVALAVTALLAVLVFFVLWPALKGSTGSSVLLDKPWLAQAAGRVTSGSSWFEYVKNYGRLFSGVTIYRYFSGPHLTIAAYGAAALIVGFATAGGMVMRLRRDRAALDFGLVFGWAATWLIFYLFAGPESILPHVERWGLCLLVPATLVIGRGLALWIERWRWSAIAACTLAAGLLLGSFYLNYFNEFATSGGRSHRTFVTATIEPKQQALEVILARRRGGEPISIVAQDWWQFWPIAYLAQPDPRVTVMMKLPEALPRDQLFFVEFAGSPEQQRVSDWIGAHHLTTTATTISDASGRALFVITESTGAAP